MKVSCRRSPVRNSRSRDEAPRCPVSEVREDPHVTSNPEENQSFPGHYPIRGDSPTPVPDPDGMLP